MRMSDIVTEYIMNMLNESDGNAEIKRNELANLLGCVPSQINYVITSRFTPEQGYIVESRRGGGGYIKITRVVAKRLPTVMHIVNSIGSKLTEAEAEIMLKNMVHQGILPHYDAVLIMSAVSDRCYADVPPNMRDSVRAAVFKNMLVTQVRLNEN
ncbi:MAG: CtsR family transcriptional regulator [Acutalibacteraceae bacterium]